MAGLRGLVKPTDAVLLAGVLAGLFVADLYGLVLLGFLSGCTLGVVVSTVNMRNAMRDERVEE